MIGNCCHLPTPNPPTHTRTHRKHSHNFQTPLFSAWKYACILCSTRPPITHTRRSSNSAERRRALHTPLKTCAPRVYIASLDLMRNELKVVGEALEDVYQRRMRMWVCRTRGGSVSIYIYMCTIKCHTNELVRNEREHKINEQFTV